MVRFTLISLFANVSAIIVATMLFFICHVITDGSVSALIFALFVLSPILISISNNKQESINTYFSKLFTTQSIKYFFLMSGIFVFSIMLASLIGSFFDTKSYLAHIIVVAYGTSYFFASPILFRMATGVTGKLPNVKKTIFIAATLVVYVIITRVLNVISHSSGLLLVVTSLIGCLFFVIAFCAITASYSYKVE